MVTPESLDWRKASASGNNGCVEVAVLPDGGIAVRNSKDPASPFLSFSRREWLAFLDGIAKGEFETLS